MAVHQHIIRKQTLEVSFEGAADAFAFKEQLSLFCTQKLLPAIGKFLDERSINRKILRADTLIIDAGELAEESWEDVLCERVVEQLLALLSAASFTENSAAGVAELEKPEDAGNTILFFLESGLLPWHASVRNKEELWRLMDEALKQQTFLHLLAQQWQTHPIISWRLAGQFKEEVLDKIIKASGVQKSFVAQVKKFIYSLLDRTNLPLGRRRRLLYEALVVNIFQGLNQSSFTVKKDAFEEGVFREVLNNLPEEQLIQLAPGLSFGTSALEKKAGKIIAGISFDRHGGLKEKLKAGLRPKKLSAGREEEQEYFIRNAGLVLLHPFLAALFENIGYTEKNKWLSEELHQRAILLSQYLVTGREEYPEFDLLLNKLLTGYPVEHTLPGDMVLSDFEKHEAKDLLCSIIKHWSALKNTSPEGLQATFLQRDGKVWFSDSKCCLKVEQKTVDILMNKLPWGISIIRTPWMDHMMHVEWN